MLRKISELSQIEKNCRFSEVRFVDEETIFIDECVRIGAETTVEPFVVLKGSITIGKNCLICSGTTIEDTIIGDNCEIGRYNIKNSWIFNGVRIGKFAEINRSVIYDESAILHHCYIGDAEIGSGVNIGAGAITANFDGENKNRTMIKKGAFIGVNANLIANRCQLEIGSEAIVAAGSTIDKNVPPNALAITRAPLTIKEKFWQKIGKFWKRIDKES